MGKSNIIIVMEDRLSGVYVSNVYYVFKLYQNLLSMG